MNALPKERGADRRRIPLQRDAVACIRRARGQRIKVEIGAVWITHHGCAEDFCLGVGETYRIPSDAMTVISALGRDPNAVIALVPAERCSVAQFGEAAFDHA
jgi:hypothetical protein